MKVLVTGGTGLVGKASVDRLLEAGHQVRLLSRHAGDDVRQWPEGVEPWPGDVGSDAGVAGACHGCQAVLHVAGIVAESPPEVTFQRVNVEGTRRLAMEAKRAGVRRFVYVSSLGAEEGASDYHRSKRAAEEALREVDPPGWLVLRPGNVYGPGDEVISFLLMLVRTLPVVPTVGFGNQPFQPVWHEDLGLALARAVEREEPAREVLDLAGPEVTTTAEILDLLEKLTGRSHVKVPVPETLARLGTRAAEALGVGLPINEDQITMLVEHNVIPPGRDNALTGVFGVAPLTLAEGLGRLVDEVPERLPQEGTGRLEMQRYWADIRGSRLGPDELFEVVRTRFNDITPDALLEVGAEPGTPSEMAEGATMTLGLPLRGNIQVRVEEIRDRRISCVTLQGHPLSGVIRFLVEEPGPGVVRFEIRSYTRPSDIVDYIGMKTLGKVAQKSTWRQTVSAVVERSGGEAAEGVQEETRHLEGEDAKSVENWVEELVLRRKRAEAPTPGEGGGGAEKRAEGGRAA